MTGTLCEGPYVMFVTFTYAERKRIVLVHNSRPTFCRQSVVEKINKKIVNRSKL